MKRTFLLSLILTCTLLSAYTQDHEIQSLFSSLETAKTNADKQLIYTNIGQYYSEYNPDSAGYYFEKGIDIAKSFTTEEGKLILAETHSSYGIFFLYEYQSEQAMEQFSTALKIIKEIEKSVNAETRKKAKYIRATLLNNMGNNYLFENEFIEALTYYKISLQVNKELKELKNQVNNTSNIGIVYYYQGEYNQALKYFFEALKINEQLGETTEQANILGNIGLVYNNKGDYSKALEYYFAAQKIDEAIGNKEGIASNLGNIGDVYAYLKEYEKALSYYQRAQEIDEESGDKRGQSTNLGNIGDIYSHLGNSEKALEYNFRSVEIDKAIGNELGLASSYGNIGVIYKTESQYNEALDYLYKALEINEKIKSKEGQAFNIGAIGSIYNLLGQYSKAEELLTKAQQMNHELGTIFYLKDNYKELSELYTKTNNWKESLEYFKKYTLIKDSVYSEENNRAAIVKEMAYTHEKEQVLKEVEHQKLIEIEKEAQKRQEVVSYSIAGGLGLAIIFSGFIFNRLRITKKQKEIIEDQKIIVEGQKLIVEEKNKDILASITYAKRIQDAILPSHKDWNHYLPNSFILYRPKDIIAGDFYWLEEHLGKIYIAAADCTGHGVPGAMVSVVCSTALSKALKEENKTTTGELLDRTREIVIEKLSKNNEEVKDGMDISICCFDFSTHTIQWSGANNPLYIIRANEVLKYTPNKEPIGKVESPTPFISHDISLEKGDRIYLFTDGYQDQFGGPKGKKLKVKFFREHLLSIHKEPINKQKDSLTDKLTQWMGEIEQVDDILIIGVEI